VREETHLRESGTVPAAISKRGKRFKMKVEVVKGKVDFVLPWRTTSKARRVRRRICGGRKGEGKDIVPQVLILAGKKGFQ